MLAGDLLEQRFGHVPDAPVMRDLESIEVEADIGSRKEPLDGCLENRRPSVTRQENANLWAVRRELEQQGYTAAVRVARVAPKLGFSTRFAVPASKFVVQPSLEVASVRVRQFKVTLHGIVLGAKHVAEGVQLAICC